MDVDQRRGGVNAKEKALTSARAQLSIASNKAPFSLPLTTGDEAKFLMSIYRKHQINVLVYNTDFCYLSTQHRLTD